MFSFLLEQGVSEERVLMRLAKPDRASVDGYDLATVKALINGATSLNLPIGDQFPEIKGIEVVEPTNEPVIQENEIVNN